MAQQTIYDWATNHSLPTIISPPNPNGTNTRDKGRRYSPSDVQVVLRWDLRPEDIAAKAVLHLPFDNDILTQGYNGGLLRRGILRGMVSGNICPCPMDPASWPLMARNEGGITSLLDLLLFPDLEIVQRYIADKVEELGRAALGLDEDFMPLITTVGSLAERYGQYLPDRASRPAYLAPHDTFTSRCPGEIKPWEKFNNGLADMAKLGLPPNGFLDVPRTWMKTTEKHVREFCSVLAQLLFYTKESCAHPNGKIARYGYAVTEKDVILIERDQVDKIVVHETEAFPFVRAADSPNGINGMMALL